MSDAGALLLPAPIRRALVKEACAARPRECCGFLLGRGRRIRAAISMPNVAATPSTRYRIDDAAHIALRRFLRGCVPRVDIVGVYHSHPAGGAVLSPTDIAEALYPEWAYLVVGLGRSRPQIRAFQIRDRRPCALAVVAPASARRAGL